MKIRYYLALPNGKEETAIFCLCYFRYSELTATGFQHRPAKIYVGISIEPKYWNQKENKVRRTHPNYSAINTSLNNIADDLTALYHKLKNEGRDVTPELFREEWEKLANPAPKPKKIEFAEFVMQFIDRAKANRSPSTISVYRNTLEHLQRFAETKRVSLTFDSITLDFGLDLQQYLKAELHFQPNTVHKVIKTLKTFMNEGLERGLHSNTAFKSKRFSVPQVETPAVYLEDSELERLWETDFSNDKKLERVRDIFLVGCYTGLRFSDFSKLTTNSIEEHEGERIITVKTQKTGAVVSIPLHYRVGDVILKYGGTLPKAISNQRFNEYLKEVARQIGLNDTITISVREGHLETPKTYKKWELITTHTARRSFATNAYLRGEPIASIMKITGHKTEKSFMGYIKLDGKENAVSMAQSDYYKRPYNPQMKIAK